MKKNFFILSLMLLILRAQAQPLPRELQVKKRAEMAAAFVDDLMQKMTLEEKIGQLNQLNGDWGATGKITETGSKEHLIATGKVGSMLNIVGADLTRKLQETAMRSRLKIPLIFGQDVIHGMRTTFPIPLGEAATWDTAMIRKAARIAAVEAAAYGIHWTFAPMMDISRDPRWGRVMEGAGEDTFLATLISVARIKGFQGDGIGSLTSVMACAKHFAAYGAAVGGRDYNSVDMSLRQLNEIYLPPFKAGVDAGVATFMTSFNDINGIPATANRYILRDKLRDEWGFRGFVVSDWGSVGEMINHGYAADNYDAAVKALTAGTDMDMESRSYINHLEKALADGKIGIGQIDDAVRWILLKKYELGLFEDPFRYSNDEREKEQTNNAANRAFGRELGAHSVVLLKNETLKTTSRPILPLAKNTRLALIGPFVKSTTANHGFWAVSFPDDSLRAVSLFEGISAQSTGKVLYAKGCNINDDNTDGFAEAVRVARQSDVVVMSLGEAPNMSGEAKSRSDIGFPGVQEALLKEIQKTGKPIVLLINAGRPLVFNWAADNIPSIVYTWWLGTEAGHSIADVLYGNYNPAGKLPMTFPRSVGQVPIYYNHYNTGRPPASENDKIYVAAYIDEKNSPKYPFGFGLSYTTFDIDGLSVSKDVLQLKGDVLTVSVNVTNSGNYDGSEVVQLYSRDLVGSVVRPVRELKGFRKIFLKKGESTRVEFTLTPDDFKFVGESGKFITEPGEVELYVGNSSQAALKTRIRLTD